jgi:stearoyl-CoA desaturase (delta-9 desaturase)
MATDLDRIPDFARFPELRWMNTWAQLVMVLTAIAIALAGHWGWFGGNVNGWSALGWGYFVPIVLVNHSIFSINVFCHLPRFPGAYRRFGTDDQSVNRSLLGIVTLGGGYHNNHHRYAQGARSGFAWFEIDGTYYILRALQAVGLIWDVKSKVPEEILKEGGIRRSGTGGP